MGTPLAGTWDMLDPSTVDLDELLKSLPQLRVSDWRYVPMLVLLATPAMAHLLDHQGWLKSAMLWIYQRSKVDDVRRLNLPPIFTSVTGIVDNLPIRTLLPDDTRHVKLGQGIALLMTKKPLENSFVSENKDDPEALPTLQFMSALTKDFSQEVSRVRHITFPLANTTFVNGRRGTLYKDTWELSPSPEQELLVHTGREALQSCRIDLPNISSDLSTPYLAVRPITEERLITDSMGNVIRKIEVGDNTETPASSELETAVMKFRNDPLIDLSRTQSTIFAKITPREIVSMEGYRKLSPGESITARQRSEIVLEDLFRGARLYKVTGGGGGWGKKQGLLSLDPAVDFGPVSDASSWPPFLDLDGIDREGKSIEQPVIPKRSTVQFFSNLYPFEPTSEVQRPEERYWRLRQKRMSLWVERNKVQIHLGVAAKPHYISNTNNAAKSAAVNPSSANIAASPTADTTNLDAGVSITTTPELPETPDSTLSSSSSSMNLDSSSEDSVHLYRDHFSILTETGLAVGEDQIPSSQIQPPAHWTPLTHLPKPVDEFVPVSRSRIDVPASLVTIHVFRDWFPKAPRARDSVENQKHQRMGDKTFRKYLLSKKKGRKEDTKKGEEYDDENRDTFQES